MPTPNDGMKAEARRGLEWRKEYGRGGTAVGVARARDIANGANLPIETVRRMRSFFARHEVDKQGKGFSPGEEGYPSAGRIAWALWGGDPGQRWANSIVRREESEQSVREEIEVPRAALNVAVESEATFEMLAADDDKQKRRKWRMVANSGGVIENHPHWGNFAIDLDGLNIGRQRKPALRDHDPQRIVGHTYSITVTDDGLVAEGTFSDTPDGLEVASMLSDGFPWQASVYVPPKSIEALAEGDTAEVNGRTIQGPGHVFRKSSLREVTFTSLGADENTHAAALSAVPITVHAEFTARTQEVTMSEPVEQPDQVEVTEAADSDQNEAKPEMDASFSYDEGVTAERARIGALLSAASHEQRQLVNDLIESGASEAEGLKALLNDHRERSEERLTHQLNATPEPVGPETQEETDPATLFAADAELVAEFGTFEVYQAFTKAQNSGAVRGRGN